MGDEEESPRVRQENEFQVLQAIFIDDIKDLRSNDVWKIYRPPEFVITLFPQQSSGGQTQAHVKLDMKVKCPAEYPNRAPTISFENAKGISTQNVETLKAEMDEKAHKLCGEVMILQLAQHVQTFLHLNNKPSYNSCYEEMLFRQKQMEEEQARALREREEFLRKKEDIERKALEEEVARRQEALKEEARLRKEQSNAQAVLNAHGCCGDGFSPLSTSPATRDRELSPIIEPGAINWMGLKAAVTPRRQRWSSKSESHSSQESHNCEHVGVVTIKFTNRTERTVHQGRCLGHGSGGRTVFVGMDATTGELVTITEWTLKWRHMGRRPSIQEQDTYQKEAANYVKQLGNIEQELASLSKLQHKNLVHYLGMKYYVEKDRIVVLVLQEFITGGNLSYHLSENIPVEYELLQHYVLGILEALSFLHRNSVVHKDIRDSSVFVDNHGLIRLADYSLDKRLSELCTAVNKETIENVLFPPSVGRGGKKGDIFRLGILCLSLAKGEIVTTMYPEISTSLSATLKNFLEKCLTRNEQERWTAESLLDHPFMKPSIPHEPSPDKSCIDPEKRAEEEREEAQPELQISIPIDLNRQSSRLHNEFEILKWLGRGGFGDVFKVKNKLDGGIYAIKRIKLNPNNKQLNRKITREVKLLSRLNHENVVRYFNSWLETAPMDDLPKNADSESESQSSDSVQVSQVDANKGTANDQVNGQEIDFASKVDESADWSVSHVNQPEDEDSTSDEEEEDIYGTSFLIRLGESSESIVFDDDCSDSEGDALGVAQPKQSKPDKPNIREPSPRDGPGSKLVQLMYIQMEFCDRSTLRDTIDNGLHLDEARVWRLFREMVEGLVHIHQQGMIHRDLKPVNIFLDSRDQVKIGDFGLATTNILAVNELFGAQREAVAEVSQSEGVSDGNLTGWVGTKLYTSPEVANPPARPVYNQKVDIYSLGIIFFEMCYQPLNTAMERVIVLENLRKPEIIFPQDFLGGSRTQQISIIQWLLSHDPALRPTSLELLQSSYLPPPQMEEAKLQDMLRHTISNPQSKIYKHMISTLFQQKTSTAANVTYDIDMHKGSFHSKTIIIQKHVTDTIEKVFRRHGAIYVTTPLLTPNSKVPENNEQCVNLVDHGGGVVSLPQNLRVPFCRFLVKNKVTQLKRYHMSPIYRERKIYGCHPRTIYECAFDIVTPTPGNLVPDAEVLNVIWEIVSEFQPLQERHCVIRLNHTSLLKGILMCCGIPEERHLDVYKILNDSRAENLSKYQVQMRLTGLNLPDQAIQALFKRFETEGPLSKIADMVKPMMRRQHQSSTLLRQGMAELETTINNATSMGLKVSVVVAPNLVYSIHHFSGIVFQFVCELRKKRKKEGLEVLATGGRYDQLLANMRSTMDVSGDRDVGQSAVGFSMAIEKLVTALTECEDFTPPGAFDVVVCSIGNQSLLKQKSAIVHDLRNAGISAHMHYDSLQSLEDIQELCKENLAYYMVILKDNETTSARVRCWDKDKLFDKKVSTSELVDFLAQKGLANRSESQDNSTQMGYKVESNKVERSLSENISTANIKCNATFLTEDKLAPNVKRRQEGQMMSHLNQVLLQFSPKLCVEIIAVDLTSQVLKTIATHLELDGNETTFSSSVGTIIERHQRHRKYLNKICDLIHHFRFDKQQPVLVLYGLTDGSYKVLM